MGHTIITFDEVGFRLVPVYKRVWYFKGKKPKGFFFWSNKKLNLFGALIDGKKIYYEFFISINSLTFRTFLNDLKKKLSKKKKYVFLLDNASYHKSAFVMKFIQEEISNAVVEFLPAYCPELNPTETCWKIARAEVTNSTYYRTIDEIKEALSNFFDNHIFRLNLSNYLCR